jgi:hypothetical protein
MRKDYGMKNFDTLAKEDKQLYWQSLKDVKFSGAAINLLEGVIKCSHF